MARIIDQNGLGGDWVDRSQQILEIGDKTTFEKIDATLQLYSVSNPHPGFGKDPNIINELGHTKYPMWVDSLITGQRILVNSAEEEAHHTKTVQSVPQVQQPAQQQTAPEPVKTDNPWAK